MKMHNPPHPGVVLQVLYLRSDDSRDIIYLSRDLGVSHRYLFQIVRGKKPVTQEVARRLSKHFTATTPELWLRMQKTYDEFNQVNQ